MDHTGFAPAHGACALLVCTTQATGCSAGALGFVHFPGLSSSGSRSQVPTKTQTPMGVHFVPFPGPSSSGDQVLGGFTVPGGLCILITFLLLAALFPGFTAGALSQVCCVSPVGS